MYPYSPSVTPAARTHVEAQVSFLNDVTKTMFQSFQDYVDLNLQLAQTLLEETTRTGQQILTAERQTEVIGAAASRAQPTAEKMRAYQQHLSRIAADSQVEMARVTEEHISETSRTARALAEEVQRTASEETERNRNIQQEAIRQFRDPFADRHGRGTEVRGSQTMQSEGHAGASMQGGSTPGSTQGSQAGAKPGTTGARRDT